MRFQSSVAFFSISFFLCFSPVLSWLLSFFLSFFLSLGFIQELSGKYMLEWHSDIISTFSDGSAQPMYLMAKCLIELYECLSVALFFCLTWLASTSVQLIIDDVESYGSADCRTSKHRLMKWKQSYHSISSLVGEIGRFFETPLLVYFVKQFFLLSFLMINAMFEFYHERHEGMFVVFDVVQILRNFILMLLVVIGSQCLSNQVRIINHPTSWPAPSDHVIPSLSNPRQRFSSTS